MELTMLGTGNALAVNCYNTCFLLYEDGGYFLVDCGGGNGILRQLKDAGVSCLDIHDIFITHGHTDHLMGVFWMIRVVGLAMKKGQYEGELRIYGHNEVITLIDGIAELLKVDKGFLGSRIRLIPVKDREQRVIIGHPVTFYDIYSIKMKQFGFSVEFEGERLTCCGDEPYNPCYKEYAQNSDWLLHEAYCLDSQKEELKPREKHHSTVKDACENAETLHVKNLVLYHTEDSSLDTRKEEYMAEGKQYYCGNIYVPDDLERIVL